MVGVDEILIGEGGRVVDGGFTGSVVVEKVACLDHEIFDYAVDGGVFVAYWSGGGRGLMFSGRIGESFRLFWGTGGRER